VQIIASVDAGGRSTSQHSQLGRSSSTPQVYLMMTTGTPAALASSFVGSARFPGRALSAGAADVRQPMRGLNLLLRRPPDASPGSWTALTSCRGSASCNVRKALVCRQFRSFYCRCGHIPNVRYSISGPPHPRRSDIEISFLDSRRNCAARCRSAGGHMKLVMISPLRRRTDRHHRRHASPASPNSLPPPASTRTATRAAADHGRRPQAPSTPDSCAPSAFSG